MNLVDEDDDVWVLLYFLDECLDALLKLATVFGACNDGRHVEVDDALVEQHGRGVPPVDELCKSFNDSAFSHAGFTDEDGVVLLSAAQDFGDTLYFAFTSYDGVKFSFCCRFGQVGAEVVEHRSLSLPALGACGGCLLF